MRSAVLFFCVCASYAVVGQDVNIMRNMPKYDSRYDYLDVDAILDSKRLVKNYVECLVNSQRCSPEGKQLKRILPEALRTKCVRCTDKQKRTAVKVIKRLKYEFPEEWAKLSSKWDPTGDFTRYFETVLAKDSSFNAIVPETESPSSPIPRSTPTIPPTSSVPPSSVSTQFTSHTPSTAGQEPAQPDGTTPDRPVILNRFGDEDELITSSFPAQPPTPRPMPTTRPTTTARPTTPAYMRPMTSKPTPMTWDGAASDPMPTRFPLRPVFASPAYTTAITIIDQIGYKIMRTTELVTDILRNTVRAVVGR